MEQNSVLKKLEKLLSKEKYIQLCILFGSMLKDTQHFESDIDVAVAANSKLSAKQKQDLIEKITSTFERPVDLIDLQATSGTLLHHILTRGEIVFSHNAPLYAGIIKKMLYNQADFMPYYHRILKERRERWIKE